MEEQFMKKIYLGILAAGLLSMASCTNEVLEIQNDEGVKTITSLTATLDELASTRAYLQKNGNGADVLWSDDDEIAVYSDANPNPEIYHATSVSGNEAVFEGNPVTGSTFYAVYPHRYLRSVHQDKPDIIDIASEQFASSDYGYQFGAPMVATSNGFGTFTFKQTTGLIHVTLRNMPTINEIYLESNGGEFIMGDGYIDLSNPAPVWKFYDSDNYWRQSIVYGQLDPESPAPEPNETKDFYFIVAPVTLSEGFSLCIEGVDTQGNNFFIKKSTDSLKKVERANVYNFKLVDVNAEIESQAAAQAQLEVEQKATLKTIWDGLLGNPEGQYGPYPESWTDDNSLRDGWQYVDVDQDGYVTSLFIFSRQMGGTIPATIAQLTHLQSLGLQSLGLTGEIPDVFGSMENLDGLYLQDNLLEGTLPPSIYNHPTLCNINIANNYFNFTITNQMQQNSVMWQNLENGYFNPQNAYWDETTGNVVQNKITIEGTISSITLSAEEIELVPGSSTQIYITDYTPNGADISKVVWERFTAVKEAEHTYRWEDDDNVISLGADGTITANAEGEAYVRVRATDKGGVMAHCHITVLSAEDATYLNELRTTLMELYEATDGSNWKCQYNWGTDAPLNTWEGLTFNEAGKLTEIHLYNNNMNGRIPENFWRNLNDLEVIQMSENRTEDENGNIRGLTGTILSGIQNYMPNLRILDLSGNRLSMSLISDIGYMSQLEELYLSNNDITGNIPEDFVNMTNLRYLVLAFNHMNIILSDAMQTWLDNLEWYDISGQTQEAGTKIWPLSGTEETW